MIRAYSPISIIRFDDPSHIRESLEWQWLPVLCNFAIYALCLAALRWWCLSRANRFLGRLEGSESNGRPRPGKSLQPKPVAVRSVRPHGGRLG